MNSILYRVRETGLRYVCKRSDASINPTAQNAYKKSEKMYNSMDVFLASEVKACRRMGTQLDSPQQCNTTMM